MIDSAISCGAGGWLMLAGSVLTYGVLILAGAAVTKYLFSSNQRTVAG